MHARQYLIPATSVLGLSLTNAGCGGDPLVGDWGATSLTYGSYVQTLPYSYSETYEGTTYTYTRDLVMRIASDLTGTVVSYYAYTYGSAAPDVTTYTYSVTATETAKREYEIVVDGVDPVTMQCALGDDDVLSCSDDTAELVFVEDRDGAGELLDQVLGD